MVVVVVAIPPVLGNPSSTLVQPTLSTSLDLPLHSLFLPLGKEGRWKDKMRRDNCLIAFHLTFN